ncbi:MAG: hypothetical protein RR614_12470, partial [Eubacterium sp.]
MGQENVTCCKACGGLLKQKKIRSEKRRGGTHIINGIVRPVEVLGGRILVLWVCSRKCTNCDKNQRMLPEGVRLWMRYALSVVQVILVALFDPEELETAGVLRHKINRGWTSLDFYGDDSTVYRWRRQAFQWIRIRG